MKAVVIEGGFGLDRLRVVERPEEPRCNPGQVLLRMRAASLNYRDLLTVLGRYNPKQPLPLVPCSDGAGEVIEIGSGVARVAVGDRVAPIFCQGWLGGPPSRERLGRTLGGPLDGTLAEVMAVDAEAVVRLPAHLEPTEGACLPCAAVTAWSALVKGGITAGATVLTQGTGGVSLFALQLAKALGARVIATSSSEDKLERLAALGADGLINYNEQPSWGAEARRLAGGAGVDLVVEVGGAGTLEQSLRAIRVGGRVALIGVLSGVAAKQLNILPIVMQQVRVQGILVGSRDDFEQMNRAIEAHRLHPVLDDRDFALTDARAALERMQAGEHFGKIALHFD